MLGITGKRLYNFNREKTRGDQSTEAQETEDNVRLWEARKSFERENDHVPEEAFFDTPTAVILAVVEEYRNALNRILSHDELLDYYVDDLETGVPERRNRKRLYNFITKFPGARASIDKRREEE